MTCFCERLSLQGVSDEITQLIDKSRMQSTLRKYKSAWKKGSAGVTQGELIRFDVL